LGFGQGKLQVAGVPPATETLSKVGVPTDLSRALAKLVLKKKIFTFCLRSAN